MTSPFTRIYLDFFASSVGQLPLLWQQLAGPQVN